MSRLIRVLLRLALTARCTLQISDCVTPVGAAYIEIDPHFKLVWNMLPLSI